MYCIVCLCSMIHLVNKDSSVLNDFVVVSLNTNHFVFGNTQPSSKMDRYNKYIVNV